MSENTEKLSEIINSLDSLLYKGYLLKTHTIDAWNKEKGKSAEKQKEYKKAFEDAINKWLRETAQLLTNSFTEKVYYFHFIHPKDTGLRSTHTLGNLISALERHLFALEEVIIRLEEKRTLKVRREISEKEYQADILYKVTYSDHTREVKINNIVLTKTDFNSENDNSFQYIYGNSNRPIGIKELEDAVGGKIKKRIAHIVRDLGFTKELKTIFFPVVTKNKVEFKNPITRQYAHKHNLPPINFKKIGRQSKAK